MVFSVLFQSNEGVRKLIDYTEVVTVKQLADEAPFLTEARLRWWIFHAKELGLSDSIVRIGGRIYIDKVAFNQWLERQRDVPRKSA